MDNSPNPVNTGKTAKATKTTSPTARFFRKLFATLFLALTAVLCLLAIIYSSPWGAKITAKAVNKFTSVTLIYKQGMLSETVDFSAIKYNNKHIDIVGNDVSLRFHLRCLWDKTLCINELVINKLEVNVHPEPSNEIKENSQVNLPFAIKADTLSINAAHIKTNGQLIEVYDFTSAINIKNNFFAFDHPEASRVNVINTSLSVNKKSSKPLSELHQLNLPEIYLPINLSIHNLTLETFLMRTALKNEDDNELALTKTKLDGQWVANSVNVSSFSTSHTMLDILKLSGSLQTVKHYPVNLGLKTNIKQNSVWPQVSNSTQNTSLQGDFSKLTFTGSSQGTLELTTNGTVSLTDKKLPYTLKVNVQKLPLYDDVSHVVHPSTVFITSEGDLIQQQISLNSVINGLGYKDAKLTFNGKHSTVEKETTVTIDAFSLKGNKNDIDIAGSVTLGDKPTWNLRINAKDFTLPLIEQPILGHKFTGQVNGVLSTHGLFDYEYSTVTVTNSNLSGVINNIPFSAEGNLYLSENWQLAPSDLSLSIFDSTLDIKGHNDVQWHVDGLLSTPQIGVYAPKAEGELSTSFSIRGPLKNPTIEFAQGIKDFTYQGISSALIQAKGIYYPAQNHALVAQVKSNTVDWSGTELKQVVSNIDANFDTQKVDLAWQGDLNSKLTLNGIWNDQTKNWIGTIISAEVNYLDFQWLPNKTITTQYNAIKKEISVSQHCWKNDGLNLCLSKDVSFSNKGNIPLFMTMYTPRFNEDFSPEDILINTSIEGDVNLAWTENGHYVINGDLVLLAGNVLLEDSTLGLPVEILSAWDKGRFTFDVDNESINSHLSLSPNEGSTAPFYSTLNINSNIKRTEIFPVSGTANLNNFNLRPFQSISPEIGALSGIIHSDVKISGTLKDPKINGKINLLDGSLNLLRSPTVLDKGNVQIDLLGDHAELSGTFNVDQDVASISGDVNWLNDRWLNVDVTADKLSILLPPHVEATIAPKINVKLTEETLRLSGDVSVLNGVLEVNELPEGSVALSKDVVFVDNAGKEIVKESRFNIETDIKLFINEEFQLAGQGFNGNLEGELLIQHGTQKPLQVFGNLNIPGGRYHAYGQRLQIEKGKVAFNGPTDNPHVDLRATRTIPKENIKVGVEIKGQANSLALTLVSSPTMTRAQTLSYLLRGQALDLDNSDDSGIGMALGAALANYSGVLKQVEKLPLLNNVEIGGSSEQISIAGYIGKKIYIKYGIGVDGPEEELTIRLFLQSRLWVETISGLENSVDIYYSFDTNL